MLQPRTLFEKLWDAHAVVAREDGATLLWVDRHFIHEGSFMPSTDVLPFSSSGLSASFPGL
jgi:homoaconitase/3-isopropylmalate dehydratase large subunit